MTNQEAEGNEALRRIKADNKPKITKQDLIKVKQFYEAKYQAIDAYAELKKIRAKNLSTDPLVNTTSIQFTANDTTQTIESDSKVDGTTITKNESGIMSASGESPTVANVFPLLEAGDNINITKTLLDALIRISAVINADTIKPFFDLTNPSTPNVTGDFDLISGIYQLDHRYRQLKDIVSSVTPPTMPIKILYHETPGELDGYYYVDPPRGNPIRDYVVSVWHPQIAITQVAKDNQGYFVFQDSSFLGQQLWSHFNQIKRSNDPTVSSPQGAQILIDNLGTEKIYLDIYQRKGTAGTGQPAFKYMWSPSLNIDVAPAGSTDNTCLIANETYTAEVLKRGTAAGVYEYETRTYTFSFYLNNHTMFFRFKNDQGNEYKTFEATFAFRLRRDNTQNLTTRQKFKVSYTPNPKSDWDRLTKAERKRRIKLYKKQLKIKSPPLFKETKIVKLSWWRKFWNKIQSWKKKIVKK